MGDHLDPRSMMLASLTELIDPVTTCRPVDRIPDTLDTRVGKNPATPQHDDDIQVSGSQATQWIRLADRRIQRHHRR
ncbi:MAG: hypothetical protein ACK57Y_12555 [Pirellulaceae bacterium]